jgi:hypothetical protein
MIITSEWTPIFNSTTTRHDIGDFHVKFTQHEEADEPLFLNQEVKLYNNEGTRLGMISFTFNWRPYYFNRKVTFWGYKAFSLGRYVGFGARCSKYVDLTYLNDADFEMIISAKSADMFQFRVNGKLHKENMGNCKGFGDWMKAMKQASKMSMTFETWTKGFPHYISTEYKVVN